MEFTSTYVFNVSSFDLFKILDLKFQNTCWSLPSPNATLLVHDYDLLDNDNKVKTTTDEVFENIPDHIWQICIEILRERRGR